MEIEIQDIPVVYVTSPTGPLGAPEAFKKLEDAINWQLKGRKFYGTILNGEYRASLVTIEGEKLDFPIWIIPGGKYAREKIIDWEKHTAEIAPKFEEMIKHVAYDDGRPLVEFYRGQKELYIMVPIK